MKAEWPSEHILLELLCEEPMHGYELAQRVRRDEALRAIWRIERSEIYFLLGKLLKAGYIEESGSEQGSGPNRVIYSATDRGRAALLAWLREPERLPRNLRTALLARVYLALRYDPRIAVDLIEAQKQTLATWLEHAHQRKIDDEVVALVHGLRAAQVQATLGALDELGALARSKVPPAASPGAPFQSRPQHH